jgi:hypothetical protein
MEFYHELLPRALHGSPIGSLDLSPKIYILYLSLLAAGFYTALAKGGAGR